MGPQELHQPNDGVLMDGDHLAVEHAVATKSKDLLWWQKVIAVFMVVIALVTVSKMIAEEVASAYHGWTTPQNNPSQYLIDVDPNGGGDPGDDDGPTLVHNPSQPPPPEPGVNAPRHLPSLEPKHTSVSLPPSPADGSHDQVNGKVQQPQ